MKKRFLILTFLVMGSITMLNAKEKGDEKPREGWHLRGYYTLCNMVTKLPEDYFRETFNEFGVAAEWRRNRIRFNIKYTWDFKISKFQEYSLLYGREIPVYDKLTLDLYGGVFWISETEELHPKSFFELGIYRSDAVLKYQLTNDMFLGATGQLHISSYNIWFYGIQMQYKL